MSKRLMTFQWLLGNVLMLLVPAQLWEQQDPCCSGHLCSCVWHKDWGFLSSLTLRHGLSRIRTEADLRTLGKHMFFLCMLHISLNFTVSGLWFSVFQWCIYQQIFKRGKNPRKLTSILSSLCSCYSWGTTRNKKQDSDVLMFLMSWTCRIADLNADT